MHVELNVNGIEQRTILMRDGVWEIIIAEWLNGVDVSWPEAINDLTQVVGTGQINEGNHEHKFAYLWEEGHLTDLNSGLNDFLSEIIQLSSAVDINNSGDIIGEMMVKTRWLPKPISTAYMLDNGTIKALGFFRAEAINDHRQVVGSHYLYEDGELSDLYGLIETTIEYNELEVVDINNQGQIVGSALIDGSTHAVLLNPLFVPIPPFVPSNLQIVPQD